MSTRATVHFRRGEKTEVIVYRHCDGYPKGLGEDLKRFIAGLPDDAASYHPGGLAARFIGWHARDKRHDGRLDIMHDDPWDIEFRYVVNCDGPGKPEIITESCADRLVNFVIDTLPPETREEWRAMYAEAKKKDNLVLPETIT